MCHEIFNSFFYLIRTLAHEKQAGTVLHFCFRFRLDIQIITIIIYVMHTAKADFTVGMTPWSQTPHSVRHRGVKLQCEQETVESSSAVDRTPWSRTPLEEILTSFSLFCFCLNEIL